MVVLRIVNWINLENQTLCVFAPKVVDIEDASGSFIAVTGHMTRIQFLKLPFASFVFFIQEKLPMSDVKRLHGSCFNNDVVNFRSFWIYNFFNVILNNCIKLTLRAP